MNPAEWWHFCRSHTAPDQKKEARRARHVGARSRPLDRVRMKVGDAIHPSSH